ncbi:RsfA family transcriptional regulator [Amphibacillus xylanus]|uniref:Prespore-specific transcriptional regulator RsfA n=1 Tax=Amphibacillus xylanus (strain ATCC 51415 / DSM 6626 / JCM 7361 / LMG 17667 / NBRC 15112 / Ep01) TaxID=698758 RepID=K0J793_AMPXN|nr:RsfA family transcriptional regulator [Amphibacillus xylanus]BAM47188.1 prespore-specific transcriptional regulator RsfA [Amphibacillus xylanus NBRC 15112]
MAKVRQDAWSHEDDLLLAETVLRHIRQGSTQLNAFEEVGDKLNRTSAACGFRWNAEVRQNYEQAVDIAKRQRKENKRKQLLAQKKKISQAQLYQPTVSVGDDKNTSSLTEQAVNSTQLLDLDHVINFLIELKHKNIQSNQQHANYQKLETEHRELLNENEQLKKQVKSLEKQVETIQEDYQAFLQIMDRARKMVVFEDDDDTKMPTFVMDKNGNLEQVAR